LVNAYNDMSAISVNFPSISTYVGGTEILLNELPDSLPIEQNWGINEDTIFNRMNDLVDAMGATATSGGVLDYFDIRFVSSTTNVTNFDIEVFSSGNANRGKPEVFITPENINVSNMDAGFEEPTAYVLNAWGANGTGTLPTNFSKWTSREQLMPTEFAKDSSFPPHVPGYEYLAGSIVSGADGLIYQANVDTASTPLSADWIQITPHIYYGNYLTYSPWTKDVSNIWKNSGVDPSGFAGSPLGPSMFDSNLVINQYSGAFRTWVDLHTAGTINSDWLYGGTIPYDGLRVLVDGTGVDDFTGYDNMVMEYRNGGWQVKYTPSEKMMVVVMDTGRIYRY